MDAARGHDGRRRSDPAQGIGRDPRERGAGRGGALLYLLAVQMARAGTPPLAVVGTQTRGDLLRALPRLARRLRGWRVAAKGASLLVELRRHGVRRITGVTDLAAPGRARAEALGYRLRGREHRIACGTVLLHQGVVPNVQASRALRLAHRRDDGQRTFLPLTDAWGETSRPALFVAGDGAGISGALAAEAAGRLPGLQVAHRPGPLDADARDRVAANARRRTRPRSRGLARMAGGGLSGPGARIRPHAPRDAVDRKG